MREDSNESRAASTWFPVLLLLLPLALPALADSARSSSGRVGYRSHGHYARPAPAAPAPRPGGFGSIRSMGIFGTGHQGGAVAGSRLGHPIQRPYFSTTSPFAADPNYPSGVAPRHPGGLPLRTFVYFGNPFPYTERVVYVPVEPERSRAPAPAAAPSAGGNPIYIVVQPGTDVEVAREPVRIRPEPAAERVERERRKRPREPGELLLSVLPTDAEVYLDDLFLGTGADLGSAGREVSSGVHVLEILHPDHRAERLFFGVPEGGAASVEVDLADTRSRRRSRLETTP